MGLPQEMPMTTTERERWMLTFRLGGDLRFLSHHDTVRLFQRALVRSKLPVKYTEGFNPHAKLSLPLPRPVGVASEAESMIVEFTRSLSEEEAVSALGGHLPGDISMVHGRRLGAGEKPQPVKVGYRFEPEDVLPDDIECHIAEVLACKTLVVTRQPPGQRYAKTVDVRPYLESLVVVNQGLEFVLRVTGQGTAKPVEIVTQLGYLEPVNHRIHRMFVEWEDGARQKQNVSHEQNQD